MMKDERGMVKDEGGARNPPRRHECDGESRLRGPACGSRCGPRSSVSGLRSPVCVVVALLLIAGWTLAQPGPAPTFKYYVWGQVRSPGAHSLGPSPDLMELLSAAGGPTQYADVRHVVLVRATTQQRVNINLKAMLFSGQIVLLSPGDIVLVPNSAWYSIREYFSITTTVVSFATLVFTILNWVSK